MVVGIKTKPESRGVRAHLKPCEGPFFLSEFVSVLFLSFDHIYIIWIFYIF